jgi:hypothetical protein
MAMGSTPPQRTLTEEVAEFLARGPSPEETARFRISERAQERVHTLMERHEDGTLSSEETTELDEITVLDQLFTLIRARLAPPSSPVEHIGSDA